MRKFFAKLWTAIRTAARQLWSLVSDHEWDLDPYKLGGFGAYVIAGILALKTAALVSDISDTKLGIMAGLVSVVGGLGTTLFGQARRNDATLAGKAQP
jgi:nitrate/nitrite transporter NarK